MLPDATDPFLSAWLKWGWAALHTDLLEADIDSFTPTEADGPNFTYVSQYHADEKCVRWVVNWVRPIPFRWQVRLGDIVHNYRSCLDHIAWALVHRGTLADELDEKALGKIYFPICRTPRRFKNAIVTMLPGVTDSDLDVVRGHQPYLTAGHYEWMTLSILKTLSNGDKHRAIRPVLTIPDRATFEVGIVGKDCEVTDLPRTVPRPPLEVGAEIYRVYVKRTGPNPDVALDPEIFSIPSVENRVPLAQWVDNMNLTASKILRAFSEPPIEALDTLPEAFHSAFHKRQGEEHGS